MNIFHDKWILRSTSGKNKSLKLKKLFPLYCDNYIEIH